MAIMILCKSKRYDNTFMPTEHKSGVLLAHINSFLCVTMKVLFYSYGIGGVEALIFC